MWFLLACAHPDDTSAVGTCAQEDPGPFRDPAPSPPVVAAGPSCRPDIALNTPLNVLGANLVAGTADDTMLADLDTFIDASPNLHGPWGLSVTGPYQSEDGRSFSTGDHPALDCASVPDVVEGPDGRLWMVFVDTDLDLLRERARAHRPLQSGWVGVGGLGMAVSDDGNVFTRVPMEIAGDLPLYVVDPDIAVREDGSYDLYFYGVPAEQSCADTPDPSGAPSPHRTYRATSTDLQHWTLIGPVWTPDIGTDPAAWCQGDTCYLYMGQGARSTDGGQSYQFFDFGKDFVGNLVDVFAVPDGFRGYGRADAGLETFVSPDGATWTSEGPVDIDLFAVAGIYYESRIWLY